MIAWSRLLVVVVVSIPASDLHAGLGDLFRRNKPDPVERVPALLKILKNDRDEGDRADAAQELRNYDPNTFPEIHTGLIEAVQNDPAAAVRIGAIESLSKLRPINTQAGYALEQALAHDSTAKVRAAAKSALFQYSLLGYRTGKPLDGQAVQSNEPPLAAAKVSTVANVKPKSPSPAEAIPNRAAVPATLPTLPTAPTAGTTVAKADTSRGFLPRLFGRPEPTPVPPSTTPTQPPTTSAKVAPVPAIQTSIVPRSLLNQSMEPPLANPLGTAPVPAERNGSSRTIVPVIASPTTPFVAPVPKIAPSPPIAPVPTVPLLPARPVFDPGIGDEPATEGPVLAPRK